MIPGFILGILGGVAAAKVLNRFGAHGGGCCGAQGGRGQHPGTWRRGGRARWWISRELGLDERQQAEVEVIFERVRGSFAGLRAGRWEGWGAAIEAFGPETFDRSRVEQAATQKGEALAGVRQEVIDALARLHEILTPAQREQLRALASRFLVRG